MNQSQPYLDGLCPNEDNIPKMYELYYNLDTGKAYRYGRELKHNTAGYIITTLRGITSQIPVYFMNWLIKQGALIPPNTLPDHIDNNPSNNHPDNLRALTAEQNIQRMQIKSNNKSGIKRYVYIPELLKPHKIQNQINGKIVNRYFNTKNQARKYSNFLTKSIEQSLPTKTFGDYFDEIQSIKTNSESAKMNTSYDYKK